MTQRAGPRIGLIGVGAISDWHVRALRIVGLEVSGVAARAGSSRLADFAARHGIPRVFPDWPSLLSERGAWDGLVIATDPFGTPEVLAKALAIGVPILVEKPVARTSWQLRELCDQAHTRVIVGFNRRFYRPVLAAREVVREGPPALVHLILPEKAQSAPTDWPLTPFFENSCHGLDVVRFLCGELAVASVHRLRSRDGRLASLAAVLTSGRGDVIQITVPLGTPANFSLTIDWPGRRVELKPFELVTIYEGMEILPPSEDLSFKRYMPKVVQRIRVGEIDQTEKPGFVRQAEAFKALITGAMCESVAATLADALAVIELCEALSGEVHPVIPQVVSTAVAEAR